MKILDVPRSGSYQGITSSRNRYGQYVRTRAIPVQPRTPPQGVIRGTFGVVATIWRTMTDSRRAGWSNMGANYSVTDSLGQSNPLNGFSFFQSANLDTYAATGAIYGDNDAPITLASFVFDLSQYAIDMDSGAGSLGVTFDPTPAPTGHSIIIQSTGPVSSGMITPPGPHPWRQVAVIAPAATSPADIFTPWVALFGPMDIGKKVFFRLREYDADAARSSSWATIVAVVHA